MGLAVDHNGNVYVADSANHRICKVAADGSISTLAGTGTAGYNGDAGPASGAQLNQPEGVAVDGAGIVYFADTVNDRVRAVTPNGNIATVAGTGLIRGVSVRFSTRPAPPAPLATIGSSNQRR